MSGRKKAESAETIGLFSKSGRTFSQLFTLLRLKMRNHIEYHYFIRYLLLLLLPILLIVFLLSSRMIADTEKEARSRLSTAMENSLENLNAEIAHLNNTTMQIAANPVFKTSHPKELPDAFESIRDTLENIMSSNKIFQQGGITFYSATTPTLFYTEMGTYNETYFRYYELENNSTVSIRTVLENTDFLRIIPYHAIHTYFDSQPSLDIIYAMIGQPGSFMIYSILEKELQQILLQDMYHPDAIYLVHSNGYKLYPLNQESPSELDMIYSLIREGKRTYETKLTDNQELIMVYSNLYDMVLAYIIPEDDIYGSVHELNLLLNLAVIFIGILGVILITVLSFWNARPIREILYLTERLSTSEAEEANEAALDRIRTILIQLYTTHQNTLNGDLQDPKLHPDTGILSESPDADLLLELDQNETASQENNEPEIDLVRQVIAFIDQNQNASTFNVSMLADQFHMELSNLSHQFKNRTGYSLSDYLNARKLDIACSKLRNTDMSVASIAENLGYTHASSFIRMFKKVYGITPTQFRIQAQNPLENTDA